MRGVAAHDTALSAGRGDGRSREEEADEQVIACDIPAVRRIVPKRHGDDRGWFSETYRADVLAASGIDIAFRWRAWRRSPTYRASSAASS
ncbi:hypothetical protein DK389_04270 [Methylobacterium durans]|uniref:Uncharacterized protein n=1 Tax=Methylobacterium durans TaxID=2202825 RepID=A0A2U8W1D1_9HYPH|nr:hypothetical protein DK389_04270 [Methylobacterium durans]